MRTRSKKKSRYKAQKKQRFYKKLKRYAHNTFTLIVYLGLIPFTYLLFYGLLFEPIIISKAYGSSDTRELVYLAVTGLFIGVSYTARRLVNCQEKQQWEINLELLRDVKFDLNRYSSLKRMGIDHLHKRKKKRKHSSSHSKEKIN